jgi:hypothetical protein
MHARTLLLLSIVGTGVPVGWHGVVGVPAESPLAAPGMSTHAHPTTPAVRALRVLRHWDSRRSDAWARGDATALSRLYEPGSVTGARDASALGRWVARGLRVAGLRQQVTALRTARAEPDGWVVVLTERTVGGVAVGGGRRTPLPASPWATHRIRLERSQGGWRVAEVRDQPAR